MTKNFLILPEFPPATIERLGDLLSDPWSGDAFTCLAYDLVALSMDHDSGVVHFAQMFDFACKAASHGWLPARAC